MKNPHETLQKKVGERIGAIRRLRGMTQAEMAKRLGWDNHKTVGAVEQGRRNLTLTSLAKIARALEVEPYLLLFIWGEPAGSPGAEKILQDGLSNLSEEQRRVLVRVLQALLAS